MTRFEMKRRFPPPSRVFEGPQKDRRAIKGYGSRTLGWHIVTIWRIQTTWDYSIIALHCRMSQFYWTSFIELVDQCSDSAFFNKSRSVSLGHCALGTMIYKILCFQKNIPGTGELQVVTILLRFRDSNVKIGGNVPKPNSRNFTNFSHPAKNDFMLDNHSN